MLEESGIKRVEVITIKWEKPMTGKPNANKWWFQTSYCPNSLILDVEYVIQRSMDAPYKIKQEATQLNVSFEP